jgi:uracil-DNA glycosylase
VIYPPEHLIHSWSTVTPLARVKVVIVGQDPYHGPGQACGHSFSVPKGVAVPGSLKNIYKELSQEFPPGGDAGFTPPKHGNLDGWAKQGVLMLNACLVSALLSEICAMP